jgi:hypothetical protein
VLARAGVTTFFNVCQAGPLPFANRFANFEDDINKSLVVRNFKLGAKEKIGEQHSQIVHYEFSPAKEKDAVSVSVWINTRTHLPVKQAMVITATAGGKTANQENVITFRTFTVDGPIDPKVLELPK